jgi:acetyl-CoA carboxylase biotin carboxyl carrier protein
VKVDIGDIQSLLHAVDQTDVSELILESGDFKLTLRKATPGAAPVAAVARAPEATPVAPAPAAPVVQAPSVPGVPAAVGELVAATAKPALTINAPMVGTFYRAPSPDATAFCDVGDVVKPGSPVCIIEAMKLMNELESEVSGRVVSFLVENGEPVEFGQPLIALEPV